MKYWLFVAGTMFIGCDTNTQNCDPVKVIFCEKEESYIELFSITELMHLSDSTRKRVCDESYFWSELEVGDLNIPAEILPKGRCERFESIGCVFGLPKTRVNILSDTIFLNKKMVSIDSIEVQFQEHFFSLDTMDYKKFQKQIVKFSWDSASSLKIIEEVLFAIAQGYSKGLVEKMAKNGEVFNCIKYKQELSIRQKLWKRNEGDLAQYNMPVIHPFLISISLHK